jgi:hypothetical protein
MTFLRVWFQLVKAEKSSFVAIFAFMEFLMFALPHAGGSAGNPVSYWQGLVGRLASLTEWRKSLIVATGSTLLALAVSLLVLGMQTLLRSSAGDDK